MLGDKLERKLGFLKIPNLMFMIVVISAFVFLIDYISLIQTGHYFLRSFLAFHKGLILKGQIWRTIGFVFTSLSPKLFFAALEAYFLYFLGTSLEVSLGERKFSVFYIVGVLLTIIGGFIAGRTTITYLNMTMFFIFATINPNRKMLLFFFLPVNTIWLGVLDLAYFVGSLVLALINRDFSTVLAVVIAIVNFLIFFGPRFFLDIFYQIKNLQEKSKRMYKNGSYWGS